MAEAVRFELTGPCGPPVFKFTVEINRINSLTDFRLRNLLKKAFGACPVVPGSGWSLRRSFRLSISRPAHASTGGRTAASYGALAEYPYPGYLSEPGGRSSPFDVQGLPYISRGPRHTTEGP